MKIRITNAENIPLREGRSVRIGEPLARRQGACANEPYSTRPAQGESALTEDLELAIFNLGDGRFVAVDNACPHRGGPLCDGIVSGDTVVCPLHGWKISLETGHVLKPNVCVRVTTYPVSVEDGVISVEIDKSKQDKAA